MRELLQKFASRVEYNPRTGSLTWLATGGRFFDARYAGKEAGHRRVNTDGHKSVQICIGRKSVQAQILIWFIMTNEVPAGEIDHCNNDGWDNRWYNLREATASQNCANRRIRSDNRTGLKGVQALPNGKYRATIGKDGKRKSLGCHETAEAAHAAYCKAAAEIHGEFANNG